MRKRLTATALAKREAEVMALAAQTEPVLTTREIAERMGYADHSGAARAIRRCLRRLKADMLSDARTVQERIAGRLDDAAEQLEDTADRTTDERVRVRALAALTANSHELGLVTGAIKLPPPVNVNNSNVQNTWDLSKLSPERLAQLHAAEAEARGEASPLASSVVEKSDTKPSEGP